MGQTTTTKQQAQFNPAGNAAYNQTQGPMAAVLNAFMSNPLTASYFLQQLGMGNKQISQMAQGSQANLQSSATQAGFTSGGASPWMQALQATQGRAISGQRASLFGNMLMGANQLRLGAANTAAQYKPLQTGQTTTQSVSGVGSWLPQVVGAGLGVASSFAPGGSLFKGLLGGGASAAGGAGGGAIPPEYGGPSPLMTGASAWNPYGSQSTNLLPPAFQNATLGQAPQ